MVYYRVGLYAERRCRLIVTQPKTANSVRTIYLPKETVDLLIQEHAKHPDNPVMFRPR